jgi:hypothetical protein
MNLATLQPRAERAPLLILPRDFAPLADTRANRRAARAVLAEHGAASLLTLPEAQPKLGKSATYSVGLSLAPADVSGIEVCPGRGECAGPCVLGPRAGLSAALGGVASSIIRARIGRTRALAAAPQLIASAILWRLADVAKTIDGPVAVRLNVGSDLPWEDCGSFVRSMRAIRTASGRRLRAYDYTKLPGRVGPGGYAAEGYRLIYSVSERSDPARVARMLDSGACVALVVSGLRARLNAAAYRELPIPTAVRIDGREFPTIDGDRSDDRGRDRRGHVVILRGKSGAEPIDVGGCAVGRDGGRFALRADSPVLTYRRPLAESIRRAFAR